MDNNWETVAPHLLDFNYTIPLEKHAEVSRKIRNHYFGSRPISKQTARELTYLIGDRLYVVDGEKAARAQAKVSKSPVLFWYYSYRALNSVSDRLSQTSKNFGMYN